MTALVTGAGGFLGGYIVEQLLARGDRVRAFCGRRLPTVDSHNLEIVQDDIRDRDAVAAACEQVEVVFHTAAVAGIWGPWDRYHGINTLGTQHVLEGCRRHRVRRLVFSSSPSVTFAGGDQCGVNESAPYASRWLCHYPHTKALAEQMVLAANGSGGLLTCSLRPHLIWGPRDTHLVPRLIERGRRGKLRRVGDGKNLIDMVYVENAAQAHLLAADALQGNAAPAGRAYFISQGEPVNCWHWIDELLALAGVPAVKKSISARAAWNAGAACEAAWRLLRLDSEPRMTRFLAAQLSTSHYFDISAARGDFGYEARISTAEGMCRLKRWLDGDG